MMETFRETLKALDILVCLGRMRKVSGVLYKVQMCPLVASGIVWRSIERNLMRG